MFFISVLFHKYKALEIAWGYTNLKIGRTGPSSNFTDTCMLLRILRFIRQKKKHTHTLKMTYFYAKQDAWYVYCNYNNPWKSAFKNFPPPPEKTTVGLI